MSIVEIEKVLLNTDLPPSVFEALKKIQEPSKLQSFKCDGSCDDGLGNPCIACPKQNQNDEN